MIHRIRHPERVGRNAFYHLVTNKEKKNMLKRKRNLRCGKGLLAGFLLSIALTISGQTAESGNQLRVSLLTCSPSNDETYTLYGHTAIRIQETLETESFIRTSDYVFNYGIFDFSKPNFIYRFARGETDYILGVMDFESYLNEYRMRGSEVCEQVLNLDSTERVALLQALTTNALPENRVYRYNFFFDNCATRPAVMIEQAVQGKIAYAERRVDESFRDMINYCTRNHPWNTFGCDLALGSPTDRTMTLRESFFIPARLKEAFAEAWIIRPDGSKQRLVSDTQILTEEVKDEPEKTFFTPLVCSLIFFVIVALLTLIETRKKVYFRWLDVGLFFLAGAAGCVLFFLSFLSVHPCMWPNSSLGWLHPLHWVGAVLMAVKKLNKAAYCYHFINFAALCAVPIGWILLPQHLNIAFIPLMLSLMLRSGKYLIRRKTKQFE